MYLRWEKDGYFLLTFCVENHISPKSRSRFFQLPTSKLSFAALSRSFFDRLDTFSDAIDPGNTLMLLFSRPDDPYIKISGTRKKYPFFSHLRYTSINPASDPDSATDSFHFVLQRQEFPLPTFVERSYGTFLRPAF